MWWQKINWLKIFILLFAVCEIVYFSVSRFWRALDLLRVLSELQKYECTATAFSPAMEAAKRLWEGELLHPTEFRAAAGGCLAMSVGMLLTNSCLMAGVVWKQVQLVLQWFVASTVAILIGIVSSSVIYRIDKSIHMDAYFWELADAYCEIFCKGDTSKNAGN